MPPNKEIEFLICPPKLNIGPQDNGVALFEGLYAAFSRELKQVSSAAQAART